MPEPDRYRELSARLSEERTRLEALRADYDAIVSSRFHGLRMLWFSLKHVLGMSSPNDVYATWSRGLSPTLTGRRGQRLDLAALAEAEKMLAEAWRQRTAERPKADPPLVSVVIPVFNQRDVTVRCLQSIAETWFETLDVQFIAVDDGSTDGTSDLLTRLPGVDVVRNGHNEGFVRACNRGAALARGKYVCFLNNDTVARGGWLEYLALTAEYDPRVGVVGSKLIYPDGQLQEAGTIMWRDATGWNYGRFDRPDDPRYNYVRDPDYVSGAAMLVRKEAFDRAGGFDERYRPAYYEDADLCFAIRAMGYRVVYQPRSEVVHHDGASGGDASAGTKRYQEVNRPKFVEKWRSELQSRLENGKGNVPAAVALGGNGKSVLVVDSYVPLYDREAGSQRMFQIVRLLRTAGYRVVFLPDNYAPLQPYTNDLQQMGVEVLHHVEGGRTWNESLELALPQIDFAWISRPDLYQKYEPLVRRNERVRVVYDTVDLAHIRKRRESELLGGGDAEWQELQRVELAAARSADATVVVTPDEQHVLQELGIRNVCIVPTIHEVHAGAGRKFDETSGLLFIANYNHPPNSDAVTWLCEAVMPRVWQELPNVSVTLVGANAGPDVMALRSDLVRVTGYVPDVASYFRQARIFVAPLRFGAGMKGKVGHALAYALPVVTTPIGAEGIGLRNGENAIIVDPQPEAFASAIVELYGNPQHWQQIADAAAATLEPFSPSAVMPAITSLFERLAALQHA